MKYDVGVRDHTMLARMSSPGKMRTLAYYSRAMWI